MEEYPHELRGLRKADSNDLNDALRGMLFLILGVYGLGHILFLPCEFVAIALCNEPELFTALMVLVAALIGKYFVVIGITSVALNPPAYGKTGPLFCSAVAVLSVGSAAILMCAIAAKVHEMQYGEFFDTPYAFDFYGFMLYSVYGSIYLWYLAWRDPPSQNFVWTAVPHADSIQGLSTTQEVASHIPPLSN